MAESAGIQSLDSALVVLEAMARAPGPMTLTQLAKDVNMPASKVHRYLASFAHAGLVQQAGKSGKYDLGPGAARLGLAAVSRMDFVNRTADALPELCADTGLTALLSVWSDNGPTIVRWERAAGFIVTTLGLGTTMPLLRSATGRVFLAYAPPQVIAERLTFEQSTAPGVDPDVINQNVKSDGFAHVSGDLIPGLAAISAPVLNWQSEIEAAVTLIGTDPKIIADTHPAVARLKKFCNDLSLKT
ncbi:IclR family transcriptional regulator [Pseudoprimorskyibacter insulae]|uniref:DNA-binding transcriptional repressor YiaJ n=1 Tax=Pseudoprimorskyibacter insulae TaxID=1695997 RepID=A0A2R8ATZ8_9RHOB|nr:IclR family transcriptional regulator [Pseudoprimorskyibacter insulae]SPF79339.1 DNA-binding transcriptional repressor YiaJ [Pseudoprimorskyibacter insulae]